MAVSPIAIAKAVKGTGFPASKADLLQSAKRNKANDEVMEMLKNLPDNEFESVTDVEQAYSNERGS